MWEVTEGLYGGECKPGGPRRALELLAEGWEPFSSMVVDGRTYLMLRRETDKTGPERGPERRASEAEAFFPFPPLPTGPSIVAELETRRAALREVGDWWEKWIGETQGFMSMARAIEAFKAGRMP